jgi:NitT/TauT family transport system substrate-binding protein
MEQLHLGYDNAEGAKIALFLGVEQGLFEKRGIELTTERISPVKLGTPRLLAGEIDLLLGNSGPVIEAIARERKPLVVVGSLGPACFAIFTRAGIARGEELKGKRFGVSTPGASQDRIARQALKKLGLEPDKDIRVVYTGFNNSTDRLRAAARGEVDAVIGGLENFPDFPELPEAESRSLKKLVDLSALDIHISGSDIAATRGFVSQKREISRRFILVLEESLALARERPDLVGETFKHYLGLADSKAVESKVKGYYGIDPPRRPLPDRLAIQNNLDELEEKYPGFKLPDLSDCIDESFF